MRLAVFIGFLLSMLNAGAKTIYDSPQSDMASFFCAPNSKYVLRYPHHFIDTVYIPQNCEIIFKGGRMSGPVKFENTKLNGNVDLRGSSISGIIKNKRFNASWLCHIDGITDDAKSINEIISICDEIFFPRGRYRLVSQYDTKGIEPNDCQLKILTHIGIHKDNVKLLGEKGTEFISHMPSCVICAFSTPNKIEESIKNIEVSGITFNVINDGKSFHELIHTIKLVGVDNFKIVDCVFNDFWGDAICLGHYGDNPKTGERTRNQNVRILNNLIVGGEHHNNRNGISIVNGKNVLVKDNIIKNTSRKDMPGGIDVEPNNSAYTIENIRIERNTIEGTRGSTGGIAVVVLHDGAPAHNISIISNCIKNSTIGISIAVLTDNTTDGFIIKDNYVDGDTKPYFFAGKGLSKDWVISGNTFERYCRQNIPGEIKVENLVCKKNKKKE